MQKPQDKADWHSLSPIEQAAVIDADKRARREAGAARDVVAPTPSRGVKPTRNAVQARIALIDWMISVGGASGTLANVLEQERAILEALI